MKKNRSLFVGMVFISCLMFCSDGTGQDFSPKPTAAPSNKNTNLRPISRAYRIRSIKDRNYQRLDIEKGFLIEEAAQKQIFEVMNKNYEDSLSGNFNVYEIDASKIGRNKKLYILVYDFSPISETWAFIFDSALGTCTKGFELKGNEWSDFGFSKLLGKSQYLLRMDMFFHGPMGGGATVAYYYSLDNKESLKLVYGFISEYHELSRKWNVKPKEVSLKDIEAFDQNAFEDKVEHLF